MRNQYEIPSSIDYEDPIDELFITGPDGEAVLSTPIDAEDLPVDFIFEDDEERR